MAKKVLHIISTLDPGGVEKWLIDLIKIDNNNEHHILCISGNKGSWFDKLDRVHLTPNVTKGKLRFLFGLRSFIEAYDYDIIHCHLYRFSALIRLFNIGSSKAFIAHSHNDKRNEIREKNNLRKLIEYIYSSFSKFVFELFETIKLAASNDAGKDLFGKKAIFKIIHCGIGIGDIPLLGLRNEDKKNKKFVTVGSLTHQKNHEFIIRLFRNLDENYSLYIIGKGPKSNELQELINKLGLNHRVYLAGVKEDIINHLRNYDGFLFPSRYEGLGLSFIEAQAAGLPCIISDKIPIEADVVKGNIKRLSLDSESEWVEAIKLSSPKIDAFSSHKKCVESDFNIFIANKKLAELYEKI
ncbi:glycosyltransferase [Pseudoalteromonas sp. SCQQ13]|uniref:glycosyltransferase n=1 Tax=Pseudoalteromonas sp. SCQQ13 TaxID=2792066 RepID=UPI0018CE1AA0|nr:glycosyltransferase [Pseudoalteromonas sp. SCQQ13]MBH0093518.1 glycosyltransferase [Pseudoalteromonas sp. SCQQ13]